MNENARIFIEISLKFVPKGQIDNIPALVQIMAWRHPGDKPLSETMMVSLLTHISVTRPQWVVNKESYLYWTNPSTAISPLIPNTTHPFNSLKPGEIGVCVNRTAPAVGEIMACRQFDEQVVISSNVDYLAIVSIRLNFQKFQSKYNNFVQEIAFENIVWKLIAILSWPQYIKSQHKLTHSYWMTLAVLPIQYYAVIPEKIFAINLKNFWWSVIEYIPA